MVDPGIFDEAPIFAPLERPASRTRLARS